MLNDDVIVSPDWLDALVEAVESRPDLGAAVSRILFPDGTLQEAGSVITRSGWTHNVGFLTNADRDAYLTPRTVDYGSACSLLIRRRSWDAVGGFCEDYFPGYFEDVDFALSLRNLGQQTIYEPRSMVVHQRHGTAIERQFRGFYYQRNHSRFVSKWRDTLGKALIDSPEDAAKLHTAAWAAAGCPRRVLIIDDRWPDARFGSGHGRMAECAMTLAASGCSVSFWAAADEGEIDFAALRIQPVRQGLATHLAQPEHLYEAVVISRPNNFRRYHALVRRLQPQAALVYDAEALYSTRMARAARLPGRRGHAQALECSRYLGIERRIGSKADVVVTVSATEAMAWGRWDARVHTIPPFSGSPVTPGTYAARDRVLFAAGWRAGAESPNGDGLRWFLGEVLPLVAKRMPAFVLDVLGSPPADLHLPLGSQPHLRFLGPVDDLSGIYDRARVAIVPLRYGAGVKVKALEALEYGVPVVGTAIAAEGIPIGRGGGLQVCDGAADFADALCRLYLDARLWMRARRELEAEAAARKQADPAPVPWMDALDTAIAARAASLAGTPTSEIC